MNTAATLSLPTDLPAAIEAALTGAARALIKDLADAALPITIRIRAIKLLLQLRRDLSPKTSPQRPPRPNLPDVQPSHATGSAPAAQERPSSGAQSPPSLSPDGANGRDDLITTSRCNATCDSADACTDAPIAAPSAAPNTAAITAAAPSSAWGDPWDPRGHPSTDAALEVFEANKLDPEEPDPDLLAAMPPKLRKRFLAARDGARQAEAAILRCRSLIAAQEPSPST